MFKLSFNVVITCRPSNDGTPLTFSKFEEKKNTEKGRRINTMRRLFWGSPSPQKRQGLGVLSSIKSKKKLPKCKSPAICLFSTGTSCIAQKLKAKKLLNRGNKSLKMMKVLSHNTNKRPHECKKNKSNCVDLHTALYYMSHDPTKFIEVKAKMFTY